MEQYKWQDLREIRPINEDEKILRITHQHIVLPIIRFAVLALFSILLLTLGSLISSISDSILAVDLYYFGVFIVISFFILIYTTYFHNYFMSYQVITTMRIIDIDQRGLFKRELNEVLHANVQNANYEQNGLFPLLFHYGNVVLETSGQKRGPSEVSGFIFKNVPRPKDVMKEVTDLYHKYHN